MRLPHRQKAKGDRVEKCIVVSGRIGQSELQDESQWSFDFRLRKQYREWTKAGM